MQIIFKTHTRLKLQSAEGFIATHLVLWRHLERTNWANLAVVLDRIHHCGQSVKLYQRQENAGSKSLLFGSPLTCQGSSRNFDLLFRRFVTILGFLVLASFLIVVVLIVLGLLAVLVTIPLLAREEGSGSALKVAFVGVDEDVVLLCEVGHLAEEKLSRERPVERLDRELEHVAELHAHCDVVVVFNSLNLAPEDQLVTRHARLQIVQCHLNLHALVQVECYAVVTEVLDLFREVQNVHFLLVIISKSRFQLCRRRPSQISHKLKH